MFRIMSNSYNGAIFERIVNSWKTLTTSARKIIIGVSQGPKYTSEDLFF